MKNQKETVKVLYFVDRMLRGGIQSLVIDWVSRFDKEKIHVDFLLLDDGNKYELEDKLKELGCNVYKLNGIWIRTPIDFLKQADALDNFFNEHHDYSVIHLHSTSKNFLVLKYAKKYNIPMRIAHSHNTDFQTTNLVKKLAGDILKSKLNKYATDYFACSKIAGEWLFGKKIVNSDKFKVIHNAIDYEKFKYNETTRDEIRKELNVKEDEILIGHVGRFENQKNHDFLIDVFSEIYKENKKYKLVMIGQGSVENKIKEKVNKLGLNENVIFAGFRKDVNRYMQAMDVLVLPSLCEGLPVVGVEAQAAGLLCELSSAMTKEIKILSTTNFIDLNLSAEKWADKIVKDYEKFERKDVSNEFENNGFDIKKEAKKLENIYIQNYK